MEVLIEFPYLFVRKEKNKGVTEERDLSIISRL